MRLNLIVEVLGISAHIQQTVAGQVEYDDFLFSCFLSLKSLVHGGFDGMG